MLQRRSYHYWRYWKSLHKEKVSRFVGGKGGMGWGRLQGDACRITRTMLIMFFLLDERQMQSIDLTNAGIYK